MRIVQLLSTALILAGAILCSIGEAEEAVKGMTHNKDLLQNDNRRVLNIFRKRKRRNKLKKMYHKPTKPRKKPTKKPKRKPTEMPSMAPSQVTLCFGCLDGEEGSEDCRENEFTEEECLALPPNILGENATFLTGMTCEDLPPPVSCV